MSLVNMNGHLLCAIDTETTGLDFRQHEVIQVAILPLDEHLKPNKKYLPFNMHIKPTKLDTIQPQALKVNKVNLQELMLHGMDPFQAADLLDEWFEKLNLPIRKKIIPLGQNFGFDKGFLKEWLGELSYARLFDYHNRDTMVAALYLNDRAVVHGNKPPFPKVNLSYIANQLEVEHSQAHDALADCVIVAECYRRMMRSFVGV